MPRKWTREERKKHIQEKYYSSREKIFTFVLFVFLISLVLYFAMSGALVSIPLQAIAVVMTFIVVLLYMIAGYGGPQHSLIVLILVVLFVVLGVVAGVLFTGTLNGLEQVAATIILGLLFLVLIAVTAFFIDLVFFESP